MKAEVAILMDWENWWALELDSKPSNDLKLLPQLYSYYKPLFERNITVDFVHPEADLSRYKLVIAPNLYLVNEQAVTNINRYVENGGHLVMSFFSGIVDENEHIRLGGYPAPFREMLGLVVEEYAALFRNTDKHASAQRTAKNSSASFWSDVIHLKNGTSARQHLNRIIMRAALPSRAISLEKAMPFMLATVPEPNAIGLVTGTGLQNGRCKTYCIKRSCGC